MDVSIGVYHIWVGKIGYVWSTTKVCPVKNSMLQSMKYLGFTSDNGFPKRLNTGRLLHKNTNNKVKKANKKLRKLS